MPEIKTRQHQGKPVLNTAQQQMQRSFVRTRQKQTLHRQAEQSDSPSNYAEEQITHRESVLYTGRRGRDCRCSTVAGGKCWRGAILELVWIYQPCGMVCLLCKLVRRPVRIPRQRCISEVLRLRHGYAVVSAARTLAGSNHRASSGYAHIL